VKEHVATYQILETYPIEAMKKLGVKESGLADKSLNLR